MAFTKLPEIVYGSRIPLESPILNRYHFSRETCSYYPTSYYSMISDRYVSPNHSELCFNLDNGLLLAVF